MGLTKREIMETLTRVKTLVFTSLAIFMLACSPGSQFTLNGEENVFQQSVTQTQVKVDILWVIDDSGSMATSQANVANNFQSFINKFQQTNFDYQIAVTTTTAWRAPVESDPSLARFKDGTDATSHTGITVIKPDTPNLEQTFVTNLVQGTSGSGDERGWQSMKEALSLQANLDEPFPRQDALLAVIFLTDEDDFSHDGTNNLQNGTPEYPDPYDNPALHDPMVYHDFLYNLTNSTPDKLNFMVNTIGIFDQTCLDQLNTSWTGRKIAQRYAGVTDATKGYKGSLCDDFTDVMSGISDSILEKSTTFKLNRQPAVDTIVVKVDGVLIPEDPVNGWTYNAATLEISFHGTAIPGAGAQVSITFDPDGLK